MRPHNGHTEINVIHERQWSALERNFIYTGNTLSEKKKITPIYFFRVFPKSSITTHHLGLNNLVVKSLRIFYLELTLLAVYVAKVALQV